MRFDFVKHFKQKARHLAFDNILYNWSLGGGIPDRFVTTPIDMWRGCPDRGRWLCSGAFAMGEEQVELHGDCWEPAGVSALWLKHIHSFEWLRDLRTLSGDQARKQARDMMESWINRYPRWNSVSWQPAVTGKRVATWIALYDFYAASIDHEFHDDLFESLIKQARHLARALPGETHGLDLLYGIKGLAYAGIAFSGREGWLVLALDLLQEEVEKQILPDGGHVSRSPQQLLETLKIFIDLRSALILAGYPVPDHMQQVIDRMAQALRFFRYADKGFALFNGTQEGDRAEIEMVLAKSNAPGKILRELPHSGYKRATLGRSLIMMDTGAAPAYPYEQTAHASPLAFEFSYGKERILVSCGMHTMDENWQDVLRGTAAHNMAGVDYRNACEIKDDGHFGRQPRAVLVEHEKSRDAELLEGSHDGYVSLNGVTHRRRLYMTQGGHDLRGEESLSCSVGLSKPLDVTLRFHLHPKVQVSLIRDGAEALFRLGGGAGWRFVHTGGLMTLENSVYLGDGNRPRKTKQLVIYGQMESDFSQIKWALQRETR